MNTLKQALLAAGSLLLGTSATAQRTPPPTGWSPAGLPPAELRNFTDGRIRHQRTLGLTLGGYALANIAVGSIAAGQTTGETGYFHRMNVYWNLVNLGLAGAGLLSSRKRRSNAESLADAVRQHENMKQLLLVNAGLDVAYVVGGAYLRQRADVKPDKANQLRGYGKSVMLQGSFLLAFDLVNYALFKRRGDRQERLLISATSTGVGLVLPINYIALGEKLP